MFAKLIRIIFLMLMIVFIAMGAGVIFLQYQSACYFILKSIGKPDKLKELQSGFLTANKFFLIKVIFTALFLCISLGFFFLSKQSDRVLRFFSLAYNKLRD